MSALMACSSCRSVCFPQFKLIFVFIILRHSFDTLLGPYMINSSLRGNTARHSPTTCPRHRSLAAPSLLLLPRGSYVPLMCIHLTALTLNRHRRSHLRAFRHIRTNTSSRIVQPRHRVQLGRRSQPWRAAAHRARSPHPTQARSRHPRRVHVCNIRIAARGLLPPASFPWNRLHICGTPPGAVRFS